MSTHSIADSFLPVTAPKSFMSHFDRPAPYPTTPPELPVETPAERRGLAVVARLCPWLSGYQQRLSLVRAIVAPADTPNRSVLERLVLGAYFDRVTEVTAAAPIPAVPYEPGAVCEFPRAIETDAERRGTDVAARFFPALAYGQRRTLVRAIARMTEHPDSPRFEVEIRAAYRGAVVEVPVAEGSR